MATQPIPAPPLTKDALIQSLTQPLSQFVSREIRGIVDPEKIWQYARLRRMDLYLRGQQYLAFTQAGLGGLVDYRPMNQGSMGINVNTAEQMYDYVLNILKADMRAFVAVIGGRSPNVQAQARDLRDEGQVRLKITADRVAAYLRSHWSVETLHPYLVLSLGKSGTTFGYVRWVTSQGRYGVTNEPHMGIVERPESEPFFNCPRCGTQTPQGMAVGGLDPTAPLPLCQGCGSQLGPQDLVTPPTIPSLQATGQISTYNNGAVELDICNATTVITPFWIKSLDQAPWLVYEYEEDKGKLCAAYPQLRANLQSEALAAADTSQANQMGRYTRDLMTSPMGYITADRRRNRWLYSSIWLPPTSYEYLPADSSGNAREQLLQFSPEGVRVVYVGGKLVDIIPEPLTRCWTACKPEPSESIYTDAYFEDYVQLQDNINDSVNSITEAVMRSTSLTIASPDVMDPDRVNKWAVQHGEFLMAKAGAGSDIGKGFFRVPAAEVNSALFNYVDWYLDKGREISGIIPPIFGGGDPEQTAYATNIKRNQALMKLNTVWNHIRTFWAQTYDNGMYWASKMSSGGLFSSRGTAESAEVLNVIGIEQLQNGGVYFQCEESFPMTAGQRRDFYMQTILNGNPQAIGLMGLAKPANRARMQEAIGTSDWEVEGLRERNKLLDIINQLAQTPPMPGLMDPMTFQPGPPQPTIAPDPLYFDPPFALQVIREWLVSDAATEVEQQSPDGMANVIAYGRAWMIMMMPPPMPPGEGPNGPPSPGKKGEPEKPIEGLGGPPPMESNVPAAPEPQAPPVAAPLTG